MTGATFRAQEDAVGYLTTIAQTAEQHGLPSAVYSDRHGIFIVEKNRARPSPSSSRAPDAAALGARRGSRRRRW